MRNISSLQILPPQAILNNTGMACDASVWCGAVALESECQVPAHKDIKIKNADSWRSLGKPIKTSGVLKSSDELFNQFRDAAIEKEVKARTQELIWPHLEQNRKYPKVLQENQRDPSFTLDFSNKRQNKCLGEEQKEHQQSLEAQDECTLASQKTII